MVHTYRLAIGANQGAYNYEVGYQANDPNAADPAQFTVQEIADHPAKAQAAVHKRNKSNPGEGHP